MKTHQDVRLPSSSEPPHRRPPRLSGLEAIAGSPKPSVNRNESNWSMRSSTANMPVAKRRLLTGLAIAAHITSGLTIVVVNKMIVHDHGLHAPALVSSTGALFFAAFTRILVFFGKINAKPVGNRPWEFAFFQALPVGVCAAGSLCFGNMALIYLDAGLVQMLKAGTPALLLLVLTASRTEVVSCQTGSLAMLMVLGSTIASLQQPNATPLGLTIQLASQLCEVLQCTAMQNFLHALNFEAWDAGYYIAPAVASCCLVPSLVLEWPHLIANRQVQTLYQEVPLLVLSGMIGIVVNFSSNFVIKFTSSLLAKLLVIFRSSVLVMIFFINGEPFTWLQVVGYVITIVAFAGYSIVKAREVDLPKPDEEMEKLDAEAPLSDVDDIASYGDQTPSSLFREESRKVDLTSSMFWFAIFVVMAGAYQAAVIGDLPSGCAFIERELSVAPYTSVSSLGMPPTPYLEPITAGTRRWDEKQGDKWHTTGALSVESAAKVIAISDGRFFLQSEGAIVVGHRKPEHVLSSSWMLSSSQFGTVYLSGLNNKGDLSWLACDLSLVPEWTQACQLWMSATQWDGWSTDGAQGEYVLRRHSDTEDLYVAVEGNSLIWSPRSYPLIIRNWLPEVCSLNGMSSSEKQYPDAFGEVTFTMTTYFHVYARSVMFRQSLASVFAHLRERDLYVREFLVVNDWYDGRSLAFNGTLTGPTVQQTREEMLTFFPGCEGAAVEVARDRPPHQKCTFVFKTAAEQGQPKALNVLLDLMKTKFWVQFEDDKVFYQDVFVSRLLAPMYDHPESCWVKDQEAKAIEELPPAGAANSSGLALETQRRLGTSECLRIAAVRMGGRHAEWSATSKDSFDVERYEVPEVLYDNDYVRELLAHGGFDDDKSHSWGRYQDVGAVPWPMFSLRPSLHNLTYLRSLEAPLFYDGAPGRFSESPNISRWAATEHGGKVYAFHWDFELEFAVRWARGGATTATISPGACMRDVSNGISSFERSEEYR